MDVLFETSSRDKLELNYVAFQGIVLKFCELA